MFANHSHQLSENRRLTVATSRAAVFAMRHAINSVVAGCAACLLCACAGMPGLLSGGNAEKASQPVSAPLVGGKRTRMTNRDIMLEWGTLSSDRPLYKRRKGADSSALNDALTVPDYSMTVEQIMTNAACRSCDEKPYHDMVVNASHRYGVPTGLIHAVIQKESAYNPAATSKRRARGLMQVTSETARFVGVHNSSHLYDPQTNIDVGTAYLKYLLVNHDTVEKALAAYNAGPGNVRKYKGVPPFRETRRYVRDVKQLYATTSR